MIDYKLLGIVARYLEEDITDEWYIFNVKMKKKDGTIETLCKHKEKDGVFKRFCINWYEYGIYLKEIIENKAHNIGLKGVWIDLNDLSKDEGYYFRHCCEVYEDLLKYEEMTK